MKKLVLLGVLIVVAVIAVRAVTFTLDETEQAVIVQFGRPVGTPVRDPGLHFKLPFIQEVRRFEKRILSWDGHPNEIPTRGREFISVDATARWRITKPLEFLQSVRDESGAQSRLDDIIDSTLRDRISSTELVEVIRSRDWHIDEELLDRALMDQEERAILQREVLVGRQELTRQVRDEADRKMSPLGIEVVDVRIKRINYVSSVQADVFERMIIERQKVAEQFRAEGKERSDKIVGQTNRQVSEIRSEAKRQAEVTRGEADAQAAQIYNEAYNLDPEFFAFFRTLESYESALGKDATLIIGTDSEYFQYLRRISPEAPTP